MLFCFSNFQFCQFNWPTRSSARSISVGSCSKTKHPSRCGVSQSSPRQPGGNMIEKRTVECSGFTDFWCEAGGGIFKISYGEDKVLNWNDTDIFEIDCSVLRINGWCVKEDASNTLTWSLCATTPPCCTTRHVSSAPPLGLHDASV